jgi:peptidyl-prolyl cis-trans isomerase SurA
MRLGLLFATLLIGLAAPAGAETVNRIAAVVNEEIITLHQLEKEIQTRRLAGEIPPGETDDGRRRVLDQLIEDALVRQRIDALGLKVSDEELEAAVQDVLRQNKINREQLEDALRQQGTSLPDYRENLRRQVLRYKLISREVQSKVDVSAQEIRDYFREHIDDYREPASLRLNRLTFPLPPRPTSEQIQAVRLKAEGALARLRGGEDFTAVLLAFSADRSAEGGDLGRFAPEDLTAAFERGVRDLPEGGISNVLETPQGFHILQVTERNAGRIRQYDSVKDEIARILGERKSQARLKEWAADLRRKSHIDIRI